MSPGGLAVVAGRRWLHRVWGDSVRLGAAAHLAGCLLLQGPTAASGKGQSSWQGRVTSDLCNTCNWLESRHAESPDMMFDLINSAELLSLVSIDDDSASPQSTAGIPNHVLSSRGYFFDNPRRYDSDDDLAWSIPPQNASARYETSSQID